ncbi:MAG TPA: mucoidy inhibitor MuiA family protein [Steroidobacteraceae bacterium]|nr:mucoidy inhibitor MuiA family protein [Steroidobacteraceae bacterium]
MTGIFGRRPRTLVGGAALVAAAASGATAADLPATLPVDRVTVYREGAEVTRAGALEIPAGNHRLVLRGLPAGIDARTLRVAVESPLVRLGGIEVVRINEGRFASEAERELRRRIEETGDRRQAAQDEVATAQLQLKLLDSLAANPAGSPTKATVDGANLGAVLATMSSSAVAAHRRVREANLQLRAIDRELEKQKADLAKIATQSRQSTEIRTALEAGSASTPTVSVSYTVADAGWTWVYEARLDTRKKHVTLARQGQVQQGSGEDWSNVELTLTTALPAGDVATPEVGSLFVSLEEPTLARDRLRADAVRNVALAPPAAPAPAVEEVVVTGARKQARESATEYLADYRIPGRLTLPADRQARLYALGDDGFDVELVARVVPQAGRAAHLEAAFRYARDVPIERGELQLYRDGAYVGAAETNAFLPGGDVRMPFGVDERVRVAVHEEQAQSAERGLVSKQTLKETRQRYDITNFHPMPISIEVVDRVPVSKHADVRVEILKGATEPTRRDLNGKAGVWLWKFDAPPQQTVAIRHYYSVQYPRDRRLATTQEDGAD